MAKIKVLHYLDEEDRKLLKWDEARHPRGKDGKFGSGGGEGTGYAAQRGYGGHGEAPKAERKERAKADAAEERARANYPVKAGGENKEPAKPAKESKEDESFEHEWSQQGNLLAAAHGDRSAHVQQTRGGKYIATLHGGEVEGLMGGFATEEEARHHAERHLNGENLKGEKAPLGDYDPSTHNNPEPTVQSNVKKIDLPDFMPGYFEGRNEAK